MLIKKISGYNISIKATAFAVALLLLINDVSFAASYRLSSPQDRFNPATLAAESRFRPFSENNGLDFQNVAKMMYAASQIKSMADGKMLRQSHIARLTRILFPDGEVEIEPYLLDGRLEGGKEYKYAVFHFRKENATIDAIFVSDYDKLGDKELAELGIKTEKDRMYFYSPEYPALRGIWFANRLKSRSSIPSSFARGDEIGSRMEAEEDGRDITPEHDRTAPGSVKGFRSAANTLHRNGTEPDAMTLRAAIEEAVSVTGIAGRGDIGIFYEGIPGNIRLTDKEKSSLKDILAEIVANALKFGLRQTIVVRSGDGNLAIDVKDMGPGVNFKKLAYNLVMLALRGSVIEDLRIGAPRVKLNKGTFAEKMIQPPYGPVFPVDKAVEFISINAYELPFVLGLTSQDHRIGLGGVGLYLARRYARNMGGDVTYVTGTGGTTFTVSVPIRSIRGSTPKPGSSDMSADNKPDTGSPPANPEKAAAGTTHYTYPTEEEEFEYGLKSGMLPNTYKPAYRALVKILRDHHFTSEHIERVAQTLARMHPGSLEIIYRTGVISEDVKRALTGKDAVALAGLSDSAKKEFVGSLQQIMASYDKYFSENKTGRAFAMKRLIPVDVIEDLADAHSINPSTVMSAIAKHPDFPIWIKKAKAKVEAIKMTVAGANNAWLIVIGQGIEDADAWVETAAVKAGEIKDTVGGSYNAWIIIINRGIEDTDDWVKEAAAKARSIKDSVGGSSVAWSIVIKQGIKNTDDWVKEAAVKVESIKGIVGGAKNGWQIVVGQGIKNTDRWVKEAAAKVESIKGSVGGASAAWQIVICRGLDNTDTWLKSASAKADSIKDKVGGIAFAWLIVVKRGVDNADDWVRRAAAKVDDIKDIVVGPSTAWRIVIGQGIDNTDDWVIDAAMVVEKIKDIVGGPHNAWLIVVRQGIEDAETWVTDALPKVRSIKDSLGGESRAWAMVIKQGIDDIDAYQERQAVKPGSSDMASGNGHPNAAGSDRQAYEALVSPPAALKGLPAEGRAKTQASSGRMARRSGDSILSEAEQAVRKEANKIHSDNLRLTTIMPDRTILCHIVTDSILPVGQRSMLKVLEQDMRSDKFSEKIVSLSIGDQYSADEFMAKLQALKTQEETRYRGYKVEFDVACPRRDLVEKLQKHGIQALAFAREGEGDITQVEGIILALRALRTGSVTALADAYKLLTGKEAMLNVVDINELARMTLFMLPVRKLDVNRMGVINRLIEDNIKSAA